MKDISKLTKSELIDRLNKTLSKVDSWSNLFTGVGKQNVDKKLGGYFKKNTRLCQDDMTNLYTQDGLSKRVVDIKIEDMLRSKYVVVNDVDDLLSKAAKKLKFFHYLKEALIWQDVYGGSLMLLGIDDGQELDQPLNENNIKKIEFLKVYDRYQITIDLTKLYDDPKENNYGEPKIYTINPTLGGDPFDVHETRVLRFDGVLLPDDIKQENDYWNGSVYQTYYERLQGIGNTYNNIETIIEEFIIGVLSIENLENLIQKGQGENVLQRLHYIDMSKHIINSILLDKEETFERISATVSGLDELTTKLESSLSAVTGIPVTRLFGQSPKGLNAAGQETTQIKQYYDMIEALREEKLYYQLERFNYILMKSKEGPTNGKYYDDWTIMFPPLWVPTEKEDADIKKINAESDKLYIESGVLFPGEVAKSRFGGTEYGSDIILSESHEKIIESEEKSMSEAAKNGAFSIQGNNPDPDPDPDPDPEQNSNDIDNPNKKKDKK